MWHSAGERPKHCQASYNWLWHSCSPCKEWNTLDVWILLMLPHSGPKVHKVCMQWDLPPGRRELWNSQSEGTRFCQSHQSQPEHPGVSDGSKGCCWCGLTIARILNQYHPVGVLRPVQFNFWICLLTKLNCNTFDPPRLDFLEAQTHWWYYLRSAHYKVIVWCDHQNHKNLQTSIVLFGS